MIEVPILGKCRECGYVANLGDIVASEPHLLQQGVVGICPSCGGHMTLDERRWFGIVEWDEGQQYWRQPTPQLFRLEDANRQMQEWRERARGPLALAEIIMPPIPESTALLDNSGCDHNARYRPLSPDFMNCKPLRQMLLSLALMGWEPYYSSPERGMPHRWSAKFSMDDRVVTLVTFNWRGVTVVHTINEVGLAGRMFIEWDVAISDEKRVDELRAVLMCVSGSPAQIAQLVFDEALKAKPTPVFADAKADLEACITNSEWWSTRVALFAGELAETMGMDVLDKLMPKVMAQFRPMVRGYRTTIAAQDRDRRKASRRAQSPSGKKKAAAKKRATRAKKTSKS